MARVTAARMVAPREGRQRGEGRRGGLRLLPCSRMSGLDDPSSIRPLSRRQPDSAAELTAAGSAAKLGLTGRAARTGGCDVTAGGAASSPLEEFEQVYLRNVDVLMGYFARGYAKRRRDAKEAPQTMPMSFGWIWGQEKGAETAASTIGWK
jgi:hypothetical protein